MLNKTSFLKICMGGMSLFTLTASTAFAVDMDQGMSGTDKMNIYDKADEKQLYSKNGFSRGDLIKLYQAKFSNSEMETVTGDVKQVLRVQFPDKDCYLIAILSTDSDSAKVGVNIGPVWFLEENDMAINEGDMIQVTGAKIRTNGRYVLIATEITKNGKTLNLRDKEGNKLWGSPKFQKGNADCMKLDMMKK